MLASTAGSQGPDQSDAQDSRLLVPSLPAATSRRFRTHTRRSQLNRGRPNHFRQPTITTPGPVLRTILDRGIPFPRVHRTAPPLLPRVATPDFPARPPGIIRLLAMPPSDVVRRHKLLVQA